MAKKSLLSIAVAGLVFAGTAAVMPAPASATFLNKDRTYSQGYAGHTGWMASWRQKWEEKKARKRAWLDRHFGTHRAAVVTQAPPPRTYRPMK
jgi:hypothetical protein